MREKQRQTTDRTASQDINWIFGITKITATKLHRQSAQKDLKIAETKSQKTAGVSIGIPLIFNLSVFGSR